MDTRLDASRLESLLESARILGSSLRTEDQLNHLLRTIMGRALVSRATIGILGPGGLKIAASRGLPDVKKGDPMDDAIAETHNLPLAFPLGPEESPVGRIWAGKPMRPDFDDNERNFIDALLRLAAVSVANAQAHDEVIRSNQELRALLDLGRGLAATIDAEEVAQMLMLTLSGRYAIRRHAIFTWKEGHPAIARTKGIDGLPAETVRQALGDSEAPVEHNDLLLLPLRSSGNTVGAAVLGKRLGGQTYSASDLEFILGLMAQATVALENAWNFREALVRQQLEKELNLAAAIQRDLFPKSMPVLPGTELAARNRQARAVGGDYYDALSWGGTNDEHLFVVIDISGKGIYASLLMANIQATLRALLGESNSLPRIAARANDLLHASTPSNKYATAIMARYDPHTGRGEYVNGGHNDGILLRASGEVELLTTTGLPVGLFPKREFDSKPFHLGHGDILFLYSDGVPDACKLNEEEFGMDRLVEVLRSQASEPLETLIDRLFHDIDKFVEGAPQHDDITMLVVRRTGN